MGADRVCNVCGAHVSAAAAQCPSCGSAGQKQARPRGLTVFAVYLGHALAVALGWLVFFAVCGLLVATISGDRGVLPALTIFGLVTGLLFGVGDILIRLVRDAREPDEEAPREPLKAAGRHLAGALVPWLKPFLLLGAALEWLAAKDFRRQSPGRGRRALAGAVVLGLLGVGLLTSVFLVIGPPPPGGMTSWEALLLVLVLCMIGAVLGVLSDRW